VRTVYLLMYPLAYRPLPLLLGQGCDEFAAEVGNVRYYRIRARSRPRLARELLHHCIPVCSCDRWVSNQRGSSVLDFHDEVAKPTVAALRRA
jgi:hypothetical protein